MTALRGPNGEAHPVADAHPYGEDRSWCRRCGAAAICDDIAFCLWHVDDNSPAGLRCERVSHKAPRSWWRRLLHIDGSASP